MKSILRALMILLIVAVSYTLFIQYGSTPEKISNDDKPQVSNNETKQNKPLNIPSSGLLSFIGKSSETLEKKLGKPDRIDSSAYDYKWWVYNKGKQQYVQIGVLGDKIVTLFATGDKVNTKPFKIGQPAREVFKTAKIAPHVNVEYGGNSYRFEFSEDDMNTRPTVKIGDFYVQLYMDKFEGKLSSIRVLDAETLIKQRPYEVVYRGKLIEPKALKEAEWQQVEKANENQIFDLTNVIRARYGLSKLEWDETVSKVAEGHSRDMKEHDYFSHVSEYEGTLKNRLEKGKVDYEQAGENIALNYVDGPAAIEGWLNSEGHRKALLNKDYTNLGVGVDQKYYTQNFIKKWN
ncbi:CAP domain-containing protein [Bacillus sp. CLL-7-23]|uniref:CAP domain-containing protein n=1 Tax=Bacillus changyiensis TaxID=3004103 RepID=A0ABT4X227_9BACI|nr:CAP domain-containing protein [Bacillus changyiensis]MDA7026340.1 CAP domain-containing protein [Bacillus changyiensis]